MTIPSKTMLQESRAVARLMSEVRKIHLTDQDSAPRKNPQTPSEDLVTMVESALEDAKAVDVQVIDVRDKTSVTDYMILASGNSTRHLSTLSDAIVMRAKKEGETVLGSEGDKQSEWVLVDLVDVLVHLMLPRTRAFYALEKLWSVEAKAAAEA